MAAVSIQPMAQNQIAETIEVAVRAFGKDSRKEAVIDFPSTFSNLPRPLSTLVAVKDGKVVGASQCAHAYLTPEAYSLSWICVDPGYQKQGIGTEIVKASCDYIERNFMKGKKGTIMLTAHHDFKFYERFGFKKGPELHFDEPVMFKYVEGK